MKAFILSLFLCLLLAAEAPATCTAPAWDASPKSTSLIQYNHFVGANKMVPTVYGVYLPPAYSANPTKRYPVLYWLHGGGSNLTSGRDFVTRLDSAIARGVTSPFIVVLVNGPDMFWTDSKPGETPFDAPIETVIINDLIPHIDSTYRTIATRDGRGIEGFSIGGRGSARIGLKYPDLFSLVSNLAGAVHTIEFFQKSNKAGDFYRCVFDSDPLYFSDQSPQTHAADSADYIQTAPFAMRILVGSLDTGNHTANLAFSNVLLGLGIEHTFTTAPNAGHSYEAIYGALGDSAMAWFNPWGNGD